MARKETHDPQLTEQIAWHYREILRLIGEDPDREGLVKTPMRAAKALIDITQGYRVDPMQIARKAVFEHAGSQIVIVKDIEFYSMCEHHILPFFGKVSIGFSAFIEEAEPRIHSSEHKKARKDRVKTLGIFIM